MTEQTASSVITQDQDHGTATLSRPVIEIRVTGPAAKRCTLPGKVGIPEDSGIYFSHSSTDDGYYGLVKIYLPLDRSVPMDEINKRINRALEELDLKRIDS